MFSMSRGLTFDDVLLEPVYNGIKSRQLVTTAINLGEFEFKIPICSSNMDTITGHKMANLMGSLGGLALLHRFMSIEENVEEFKKVEYKNNVGFSIGVGEHEYDRAEALISAGAQICCVDVAHGHSKAVNRMVKYLREKYKDNILIIAGNVATYAGADYLAGAGADVIKVGIGPGSVCSTRIKTGFGVPQLSAIINASKVDKHIIADGGIRCPADAVKALAAGADMIMLGGLFAGTEETPGDVLEKKKEDGTTIKYKKFRGMASREAQEDFMGGMADWKTAEGIAVEVECKGSAKAVIQDIMGGIRSGMTYSGASTIGALQRKVNFIEITPAGWLEGTPHFNIKKS